MERILGDWWPALVAAPFFAVAVLSLRYAMESEDCGTKVFFYVSMLLSLILMAILLIFLMSTHG